MKHTIEELQAKTFSYRKRFLELFTTIGFGHVTTAFSWAEIATVLYHEIMNVPGDIDHAASADRMVVSKGHGAGILFPVYEDLGYFTSEQMNQIVRIGGSNKEIRKLFYPGFDFYGGSLGIVKLIMARKAGRLPYRAFVAFSVTDNTECFPALPRQLCRLCKASRHT